jgi:glycosyltransferase involved in cell wall biosynthesis
MGKVLFELLREGLRQTDWTFVLFGDEPKSPMHAPDDPRIVRHVSEMVGHRLHAWEQIALPRLVRRFGCDLLHCPSTFAPYVQPVPTIITIHDTLPWTEQRLTVYLRHVAPASYRKSCRVVTPSQNSSRDIAARWPALAGKTTVIRWAIDPAYLQENVPPLAASLIREGIRPPYLLYFGGEVPHKRLPWALRVWASTLAEDDLQLVVCGLQFPDRDEWMRDLPAQQRARILRLPFVAEADMPGLYGSANAVLYPSLYEGFGFPALESQAVGTPILMSAVGSLGELAGPGAVILPLDDLEAWVAAVRGATARKHMTAAAARDWARQFMWPDVWRQFQAVYEQSLRHVRP